MMATVFIELSGFREGVGFCLSDCLQLTDYATNIFFSHPRENRKREDFVIGLLCSRALPRLIAKTINVIGVLVNWLIVDIDTDSPIPELLEGIVPREAGGILIPTNHKQVVGVFDSGSRFEWINV